MHYTIHYFNVPYIYSFTWALENVFHWFSSLKLSYLYKVPLLTLTPHPLNLLPTDTMSSKSPSLPCLNFFFIFVRLFISFWKVTKIKQDHPCHNDGGNGNGENTFPQNQSTVRNSCLILYTWSKAGTWGSLKPSRGI